ncbi:pantoate--beta-alanine ligase [Clostridium acetobutylicum]|uniref:Pantothenate synthetase n=1 Tax=Clostridium acetobutylicum (strain ATCC 824 / DSM 792 / JCM 1419 / IAM 19013 / LMG 5710 / NBRC 13948 / NRRL B-527 / VKM B-1787 / 2291 / W) TaxID=272562 RepID=PANC_CLOAB|nr:MULTISPECIES: pantoate--beta-alanine ligase [Clostridium]Q97F38.1 RecName: Full=Pantothenate synthetase; Short=PS; AltName: Full=Pantoate--beta-alanine ligase; AltName: Full=Pantoate-activating enzyme [Clostridium acetobutylicum ATCC 824]AAK80857.1 Pantoate--beta-alanine ligase [Clostridium acetobutylicum ATCC 824]ADZ21959.1 Pantoate--beta-alanine ligase [Clostridium acetobutylicum EA 2018]AEI33427.1 pantoate--beta-alanine ligase [Clostridium acetobutylicum DSM 1731]AWV78731.1 pantoate--bet
MEILHSISDVKKYIKQWKKEGLTIGLVPTMGYLHDGHKSLIERASKENDKVIVSDFVNPIQFGPNEDLDVYPRDLDRDAEVCTKAGASILFNPEPSEMYFDDAVTFVNSSKITDILCGARRPGHFRGVCTVVTKLFNITCPDRAYFGEKDAQQVAVIKRMVRDLNFDIEIVACPIIREEDGLAKSSRNSYLSSEERKAATILSKSLNLAKELLDNGEKNVYNIKKAIIIEIGKEPLAKIDYVEVVDSLSLKSVSKVQQSILVAIAVYIGKIRLIDNFTWNI